MHFSYFREVFLCCVLMQDQVRSLFSFFHFQLSKRPTVQELRAKKILKFNDYVEVCDVHDYDRR